MGGDALAFRGARSGENHCAGTHARHPPAISRDLGDPVEHGLVLDFATGALPARDQDDVELRAISERYIGQHAHPFGAANGLVDFGDEHHLMRLRLEVAGHGENIPRAHAIEFFRIVEHDDTDPDGHGMSPWARKRSRKLLGLTLRWRWKTRR